LLISGIVLMVVQLDRVDAFGRQAAGSYWHASSPVLVRSRLPPPIRYVATPRYRRRCHAGRALSEQFGWSYHRDHPRAGRAVAVHPAAGAGCDRAD
jgi:hypothetical protein